MLLYVHECTQHRRCECEPLRPAQEEAQRRGIDPNDMAAVREMVMGGKGNIYGGGEEDRTANHPSQQVPRFGSDLGFSQRGVQVCCATSANACYQNLCVCAC